MQINRKTRALPVRCFGLETLTGRLPLSTNDIFGWSVRPWESLPANRRAAVDSQDLMDHSMRAGYGQMVEDRLTRLPWDSSPFLGLILNQGFTVDR